MTEQTYIPTIEHLSQQARDESTASLWYGGSRSGKTWAAGTYGSRTCFINLEHGLATLMSPKFQAKYPCDPIVVNIPGNDPEAYDRLCDAVPYMIKNKRNDFDLLVIDSVSALRRLTLQKGVQITGDIKGSPTAKRFKDSGVMSPEIQDWGEEMNVMEQFVVDTVEDCKANGVHLIFIAHERHTYSKPAKIGAPATLMKIRPGFTGQTFPDNVTRIFDMVWHFEAAGKGQNRIFQALTMPTEIILAGTRYNGIFKEEEQNVDLKDIFKRIKNQTIVAEDKSL